MTHESYDAVFFDIGGVIVELRSVREGYARFLDRLDDEYDLPGGAFESWKSVLGSHFKSRTGTEYKTAKAGYLKATASLFETPPPEEEWWPMFEAATRECLRPEPGVVDAIRTIADRDTHVGIVSDIDTEEAEKMLTTFEVWDAFDAVTTSEAVGYTKPDSRMYEAALDAASVAPDRAVMIGDRYKHDIAGAVDAGLDAVAYGPDARGPKATYEIDSMDELPDLV
ncbi:HAD family hydrolase [Natronomonas sp. EA1]|uniref:HAD family hydrolase n=1 Tax=Natronomonas sp. EA1 TaxID=3421655 RepID=UPI003EBB929B